MKISDIIKSDYDRLFIVDPECYVLFTGDSTEDIKPFIRLGNWINLPVEIIPLIENIIITDNIIGNPSLEQFNIDIRYLPSNRYIGSKTIVNRYLEFQKIFSLDLTNASVVDIEKDIPEISLEKYVSEKNQFIGVFYRDGNFKIVHDDKNIINLSELGQRTISYNDILNSLHAANKNSDRYKNSGLIVIDHNPLFFNGRYFTSYLFPSNFFEDFSRLNIDPSKIRDLIYPSTNLINISKLLKWKDRQGGNIRIFHDNADLIEPVKNLFPGAHILRENFTGMEYASGEGLSVINYSGTYNIKLVYKNVLPHRDTVTIAFIKGPRGIQGILKDDIDAVFINYSAYEDTNLIFKSTELPVAVLDDGNPAFSRLAGNSALTLIRRGMHYEFKKTSSPDVLYSIAGLDRDRVKEELLAQHKNADAFIRSIIKTEDESMHAKQLYNLLTMLKVEMEITEDRKFFASVRSMYQQMQKKIRPGWILSHGADCKINLIFFNKSLYEVIEHTGDIPGSVYSDDASPDHSDRENIDLNQKNFFALVQKDRKRLEDLLKIFMSGSGRSREYKKAAEELRNAMEMRKDRYYTDEIETENPLGDQSEEAVDKEKPQKQYREVFLDNKFLKSTSSGIDVENRKDEKKSRLKSPALWIAVIVLMIILITSLVILNNRTGLISALFPKEKSIESPPVPVQEAPKEEDVFIRDKDIYIYANKVALKNGYKQISFYKFKEKNPDWIYPSNVFKMLDGEVVVVKYGDTLWALARKKLVGMDKKFNAIIKEIKGTEDKNEKLRLLKKAEDYAFSSDHFKEISAIKNYSAGRNDKTTVKQGQKK